MKNTVEYYESGLLDLVDDFEAPVAVLIVHGGNIDFACNQSFANQNPSYKMNAIHNSNRLMKEVIKNS